jgi:hypothetical protein
VLADRLGDAVAIVLAELLAKTANQAQGIGGHSQLAGTVKSTVPPASVMSCASQHHP